MHVAEKEPVDEDTLLTTTQTQEACKMVCPS
jgi:hypothetical protein